MFFLPPGEDPFTLEKWLKLITVNALLLVLAAVFLKDLYRFLVFEFAK